MAVLLIRSFACKHQLDHEEAGRIEDVLLKAYSVTSSKPLTYLHLQAEAAWRRQIEM